MEILKDSIYCADDECGSAADSRHNRSRILWQQKEVGSRPHRRRHACEKCTRPDTEQTHSDHRYPHARLQSGLRLQKG